MTGVSLKSFKKVSKTPGFSGSLAGVTLRKIDDFTVFGGSASVSHGPMRLHRGLLGLTCLNRLFGGCPPVEQVCRSFLLSPPP